MSEELIPISNLNDFIFCPISIYFHNLDRDTESLLMQDSYQLNGKSAHKAVDEGNYSDKKNILQGIEVYCEKYGLHGKIDTFDADKGILTERKKKIVNIYDGYVFQIYAQYFSLCEMGYDVKTIRFYSMDDNKVYLVKMPFEDEKMLKSFESVISKMKHFVPEGFVQENFLKCKKCIYEPLCAFSAKEEI